MIDPNDVRAIVDLQRIAAAQGIPLMIIGAGARLLLLDWRYRLPLRRTTKDWDFAVRMKNWTEYQRLYEELTRSGKPFHGTNVEHRVVHASGTPVDLVPFGEIEEPKGAIRWPESRSVMTVIGFHEADEHATSAELAPGIHVRVVTVPSLVLLKLVSHRDRGKIDDLADVLFILENYSRYELEERIFEELAGPLASGELPFEQAAAFLLGRDMVAQCSLANRSKVAGILDDLLDDKEALIRLVPPAIDEQSWEERLTLIKGLFMRLTAGFSAAQE